MRPLPAHRAAAPLCRSGLGVSRSYVNSRLIATWASAACVGAAAASGLFSPGGLHGSFASLRATAATYDPMPTMVPGLASAEPASPTVTPLAPPPVPPPDAAGISATTPPLGPLSPAPQPTVPGMLWLAAGDSSSVHIDVHGGVPFVPVVVNGVRHEFLL